MIQIIIIDYQKIYFIQQFFIKQLIIKRAYKGYVKYVEMDNETPLSFDEFKKFEFWKIEMSFRIYFNRFKKGLFNRNYLNFKGIFLNKI